MFRLLVLWAWPLGLIRNAHRFLSAVRFSRPSSAHPLIITSHVDGTPIWLGGLWPLGLLVVAANSPQAATLSIAEVLRRFSGTATIAVALLVASGIVNGCLLVGSLELLIATVMSNFSSQIALFLVMALLAANRFWTTPKLDNIDTANSSRWRKRLVLHVTAEQILGLAVLALVSVLGTLQPALPA